MAEDTDLDWDVELIRKAGLETRHIAAIMGIHKITASNWLNRDIKPHKYLRDKAARFMAAVRLGLEDGSLPAPTADHFRQEADQQTLARVEKLMEEAE